MGGGHKPDQYTYSLLNFNNNDFSDIGNGGLSWLSSAPNYVHTSSSNPKYGEYSLEVNTNNNINSAHYLTTTSDTLKSLFTNPFTIDWWEYRLSSYPWFPENGSSYCAYTAVELNYGNNTNRNSEFNRENCSTEFIIQMHSSSSNITFNYYQRPEVEATIIGPVIYDQYNHIAITYDRSYFRAFYNGQLTNTISSGNYALTKLNTINLGSNVMQPNRADQWCYEFHGYIDMFRVSNICRWTNNFDINTMYH